MTKYNQFSPRSHAPKRPWTVHPVWRGIGCLMMIIIPVLSYAGAVLIVQENVKQGWLPVPAEFSRTIAVPFVGNVEYLFANLLVTIVLSLIGFGIFTSLYSLMYSMLGPSQYGPLDSPPLRRGQKWND